MTHGITEATLSTGCHVTMGAIDGHTGVEVMGHAGVEVMGYGLGMEVGSTIGAHQGTDTDLEDTGAGRFNTEDQNKDLVC